MFESRIDKNRVLKINLLVTLPNTFQSKIGQANLVEITQTYIPSYFHTPENILFSGNCIKTQLTISYETVSL